MSNVRNIRWTASNMVSGETLCVRTRQGWMAEDGSVYGCGPTAHLFGAPPNPVSSRVLARVRAAIAAEVSR